MFIEISRCISEHNLPTKAEIKVSVLETQNHLRCNSLILPCFPYVVGQIAVNEPISYSIYKELPINYF